MEAKTAIAVFTQGGNESLNEAWKRFKSMLRKCKGHGFDELTQIHIFRNGLQPVHKTLLDATAGGSLMSKNVEDAIVIIDRMALNDLQSQHDRGSSQRKPLTGWHSMIFKVNMIVVLHKGNRVFLN